MVSYKNEPFVKIITNITKSTIWEIFFEKAKSIWTFNRGCRNGLNGPGKRNECHCRRRNRRSKNCTRNVGSTGKHFDESDNHGRGRHNSSRRIQRLDMPARSRTIPGDKHPMCNDAVWMGWMKAAGEGVPFTTTILGVSYMMQGDAMVNNDNPAATDPEDGGVWVQEGPHLMLLLPSTDNMEGMSRDPFGGGHYVMWDKTPMVHIMVPLGDL